MEKSGWDIATTVATCVAVIVALIPIYLSHFEKLAKARNLRMRIAVKMAMIIPSINIHANPQLKDEMKPHVIFTVAEITEKFKEIEEMLSESQVLKPEEQDIISQAVANLEFTLPTLNAGSLHPDSAKSVVSLLQRAMEVAESNGILSGKPHQPWA